MEESVPEDEAGEYAHLVVFSAEKAGMASVDKAHINKVIYEMSKDSACFKSLQEQGKRTTDKIQATREKIASVDEHSLQLALHRVNQLVDKLTQQRKLERLYCVIDMDMFYAAVEMRDNPKLIGKPVAVGGMSMICTANYEARRFGVRSAMPGFMAKKLCPQLIFVKTNFQKYKHVSMQVKNIFLEYDENLSMMSLDEAKLDLTEYIDSRLGTDKPFEDRMSYAETVVNEIRSRVAKTTRLTCSAGISSSKLLAKVASDINKPNGQCKVPHVIEEMIEFTHALQIRKIPGIGKVSERVLTEAFGIKTVGDLWGKRAICYHLCTENQIERYMRICLCATNEPGTEVDYTRKSISRERTFSDESNKAKLSSMLRDLCTRLAKDCAEKGCVGRNVTVKFKSHGFETNTRCRSFQTAVPKSDCGEDIFMHVSGILDDFLSESDSPKTFRLVGIKIGNLEKKTGGKSATIKTPPGQQTLEMVIEKQATKPKKQQICPICTKEVHCENNSDLNIHVDKCLDSRNRALKVKSVSRQNESTTTKCPICAQNIQGDNDVFNTHLDLCLNKRVIPLDSKSCQPSKKRKTIRQFFKH